MGCFVVRAKRHVEATFSSSDMEDSAGRNGGVSLRLFIAWGVSLRPLRYRTHRYDASRHEAYLTAWGVSISRFAAWGVWELGGTRLAECRHPWRHSTAGKEGSGARENSGRLGPPSVAALSTLGMWG